MKAVSLTIYKVVYEVDNRMQVYEYVEAPSKHDAIRVVKRHKDYEGIVSVEEFQYTKWEGEVQDSEQESDKLVYEWKENDQLSWVGYGLKDSMKGDL